MPTDDMPVMLLHYIMVNKGDYCELEHAGGLCSAGMTWQRLNLGRWYDPQ